MKGQGSATYGRDWFLANLADRQHGVLAWWQLRAAGFTRGTVDSRLARGVLHIVHRGVYAFGHRRLTREGRWMAAVLALGEQAVLSHRSAAALWGMLPTSDSAFIHVSAPGRHRPRRRDRIIVHERTLVATTVHEGIPVTTVEATLLDLAATVDRQTLGQAIAAAERRGIFDRRVWTPPTARPGAATLRRAVGVHRPAPVRSELERRFLQLCRDRGLPDPRVNTFVAGVEVDFFWPAHRLAVETDGEEWHSGRRRGDDRDREAKLALAGIRTHRFGWEQVVDDPGRVGDVVEALLRR
jgi:very-short-patch-repair endonuclease